MGLTSRLSGADHFRDKNKAYLIPADQIHTVPYLDVRHRPFTNKLLIGNLLLWLSFLFLPWIAYIVVDNKTGHMHIIALAIKGTHSILES